MAKKNENNTVIGLSLVGVVAIVAIFGIVYMSNAATPTDSMLEDENLVGQAMNSGACSIDAEAISKSCGQYNYLYGSGWDECFQKAALSKYKSQGCIN